MSLYALSALLNLLTSVGLTAVVWVKGRRRAVERAFCYFSLSVAFWSLFYFVWQISDTAGGALWATRMLMVGAVFIPVTFLHYTAELTGPVPLDRFFIYFGYPFSSLLAFLCFGPWVVQRVEPRLFFRFWPVPGFWLHVHVAMFGGYLFRFFFILLKNVNTSTGVRKEQMKYTLLAAFVGFGGGIVNYLLWYGIPIPPITNGAVSLFVALTGYAILRHNLMDLRLAFRYSTLYMVFSLIFATPWLLILLLSNSRWIASLAILACSFTAPSLFSRIKDSLTRAVDWLPLFRGQYEGLRAAEALRRMIGTSSSLKRWAANVVSSVNRLLEVEGAALYLRNERGGFTVEEAVHWDMDELFLKAPQAEGELVKALERERGLVVKEAWEEGSRRAVAGEMDLLGGRVAAPFFDGETLAGILLVGPKLKAILGGFRVGEVDVEKMTTALVYGTSPNLGQLVVSELIKKELGEETEEGLMKMGERRLCEVLNRIMGREDLSALVEVETLELRSMGWQMWEKKREGEVLSEVERGQLNRGILQALYGPALAGPPREVLFNADDLRALWAVGRGAGETLLVIWGAMAEKRKTAEWAHDLRHPFAKGSFTALPEVLEGKRGPVTVDQKKVLGMMWQDAQQVKDLMGMMMDSEQMKIGIKPTSARELYQSVKERFDGLTEGAGLKWEVMLPPEDMWVMCDGGILLLRVLSNLIDNGVRHTPKGGLVEVGWKVLGGEFVGWVKNTGSVIPKERMDQLFKRGSQGLSSDGKRGSGGLGLYNASETMQAQKGRLWVESSKGEGTLFLFSLPLASTETGVCNAPH